MIPRTAALRKQSLVAGTVLVVLAILPRVARLQFQFPSDDEFHVLRALSKDSYWQTFGSFQGPDNCIPLSLVIQLLKDTVGLNEISLRVPTLVAGIALVLLLPVLASRRLRLPWFYGTLLAISPALVFYSRYARPYAMVALLGPLALFLFLRWLETGDNRRLVGYGIAAVACSYFHILAMPLVLSCVVCAVLDRDVPPRIKGRSIVAGLSVLAAVAALLAVPFVRTAGVLLDKAGRASFGSTSITGMGPFLFGTWDTSIQLLVGTLALVGMGVLLREDRRFTAYLIAAIVLQLAAVIVVAPMLAHLPPVLFRYSIGAMPLLLLFVARGTEFLVGSRRWSWLALAGLLGLLVAAGPLPAQLSLPANNFMGHKVLFFRPDWGDDSPVHPFYEELARKDGGALLEVPFDLQAWGYTGNYLALTQRVHGRQVRIWWDYSNIKPSVRRWLARDRRVRFATLLPENADLHGAGIEYVIIHKNRLRENQWPMEIGTPVYEDGQLLVLRVYQSSEP